MALDQKEKPKTVEEPNYITRVQVVGSQGFGYYEFSIKGNYTKKQVASLLGNNPQVLTMMKRGEIKDFREVDLMTEKGKNWDLSDMGKLADAASAVHYRFGWSIENMIREVKVAQEVDLTKKPKIIKT